MKKIKLSLVACQLIRPVHHNPMIDATANMANKLLEKMTKKK
jgi:hypothetical protein